MPTHPVLSRQLNSLQQKIAMTQEPHREVSSAVETSTAAAAQSGGTIGRAQKLKLRFSSSAVLAVLICVVTPASDGGLLVGRAYAQSKEQNPLEKARTSLETLINRLRGRDMPEGIVKSNGRLEATEVDVAAKYPGRLATLTVNEGDEVTAGQVVGTISSPETRLSCVGPRPKC